MVSNLINFHISRSNVKVQEYLNNNLEQIAKVRKLNFNDAVNDFFAKVSNLSFKTCLMTDYGPQSRYQDLECRSWVEKTVSMFMTELFPVSDEGESGEVVQYSQLWWKQEQRCLELLVFSFYTFCTVLEARRYERDNKYLCRMIRMLQS